MPSGISSFDGMLGGGYGKGKLIAVAGGAASGKTLFALQTFLARKFTESSRGLIISSEESSEEVRSVAARFSFKTGKYLNIEKVSGGADEITALLRKSARNKPIGHLLINSLAYSDAAEEKETGLAELLSLLVKLRINTVLVYNTKTEFLGKRFPDDCVFERSDGFILLKRSFSDGEENFSDGKERFSVRILKMRAAEFAKSEKALVLEDKGLAVKENSAAQAGAKSHEIFVVSNADDADLENEFSERFRKEYPGRHLSFVGITGHNDFGGKEYNELVESCGKRFSMVLHDLFLVKRLAREKKILPFGHLLEELSDANLTKEYYPEVLEACRYNGRLYALPSLLNGSYLLYRKDLFDKYGLTKPESNDDLAEKVKRVMEKEPGMQDGFVYALSGEGASFLLLQNAAAQKNTPGYRKAIYSPDSYREVLEFLLDCKNRFRIARKAGLSWAEKLRMFSEGKVVSGIFWQYDYFNILQDADSALKGKIGIMPYPKKRDGSECTQLLKGVVYTIPADTPNYSDSMRVIKFLTSAPVETRIRGVSKLVMFSAKPEVNLRLERKYKEMEELMAGIESSCYPGDFISNNYIKTAINTCVEKVSSGGSIGEIMEFLGKKLAVVRRSRAYENTILEAESFILENLGGKLTLGAIAERAKVSRSNFSKIFLAHTGKTLCEYILEKRIEKAKELIRGNERFTLGEIAKKTGFYDLNHFSRIFKKHTKTNPSKYLLTDA